MVTVLTPTSLMATVLIPSSLLVPSSAPPSTVLGQRLPELVWRHGQRQRHFVGCWRRHLTGKEATIIHNSTIGAGAGNDAIYFEDTGRIQGSRINLGKGNDTVFINGMDVLSGTLFSGTTIYGGAGADYFLKNSWWRGQGYDGCRYSVPLRSQH